MIGDQPTGTLPGIFIWATSHQGLKVEVDGKPARFAIVGDDGQIIASGDDVAREAEAVAINGYREVLKGKGWLRTYSKPIVPGGAA